MPAYADTLRANLDAVRARIAAACARAGRPAVAARLVAVTKGLGAEATAALAALGQRDLAENRVQPLLSKQAACAAASAARTASGGGGAAPGSSLAALPRPRWHLIGHLQRNKVQRFLQSGAYLHALDSERLLEELERRLAAGRAGPLGVLVEVNVAAEPQKHGLAPRELPGLLERAARGGLVRVEGLMAMTPAGATESTARSVFAGLRALRDEARAHHPSVVELSMGMTQDFELACEEGATLVRVGSALAAGLPAEALARARAAPADAAAEA